MKTDFYTKTVLTIIAFCLSILTLQNIDLIPKTYASEPTRNLNIEPSKNYGLVPINKDGSIDVNIKSTSSEMDVNISDISTRKTLGVNIEEVGGYFVYGKVPVQIK
jgi:hypothetical protein